jgi:hypothetical protein
MVTKYMYVPSVVARVGCELPWLNGRVGKQEARDVDEVGLTHTPVLA